MTTLPATAPAAAADPSTDMRVMAFGFLERIGDDETRVVRSLIHDDAGMLSTVLAAFASFLRDAGFTYVTSAAVEFDDGRVVFGGDN